jgi:hypothetical protein
MTYIDKNKSLNHSSLSELKQLIQFIFRFFKFLIKLDIERERKNNFYSTPNLELFCVKNYWAVTKITI